MGTSSVSLLGVESLRTLVLSYPVLSGSFLWMRPVYSPSLPWALFNQLYYHETKCVVLIVLIDEGTALPQRSVEGVAEGTVDTPFAA